MASEEENMIVVQLTNPEGDIESCRMSKELVQMLKHPECDATVKQQVLEAVFEGKNNIPDEKIPEAKISDENECSAASGASCNSSSIGKEKKLHDPNLLANYEDKVMMDKNCDVFLQKFYRNISPSSETDISVLSLDSNEIETFVQKGYSYSWDSEESTKCFPSEDTSPISSSMGELNVNGIQISSTTFVSQIEFLEVVSKKLACKKVKIMTKRRRHRRRNFYRRR